jgi:acetylornithine aminotransferase
MACLVHVLLAGAAYVPLSPASIGSWRTAHPSMKVAKAVPFDTAGFDKVVMKTYGRFQLTVDKGKGCWLWDASGKKYLDFAAGIATTCLGHADPRLVRAVTDQISTVHHTSNLYYIPQQGALAKRLVDSSCADRAFFCNSGAEANEAAIKLARKHAATKLGATKPVIITAHNSFHGRTLATITATAQPKYQAGFGYGGRMVEGFEYVTYNDVAGLRKLVKKINGGWFNRGRKVAAIMLEPLQGEGGITPATGEFFRAARELCDETGALLMSDEVQTGMGRTGEMWGYMHHGVEVDVLTSAKALGGGVPIGAMLCKEHANVFGPGDHASTYGGNPLACAAGNAVFAAFEDDGLLANVRARSAQLVSGLEALGKAPHLASVIKEVRGWGLIVGLELAEECGVSAADVTARLMEAGMLVVPAGPKVVRFVPPLVVTQDEVEVGLQMLGAALGELAAQKS